MGPCSAVAGCARPLARTGIGLFAAADHGGLITLPPAWWLAAAVLATLAAVAGLAAVPARVGARRPAAEILQAETA
jgi:hypothetical protein